jgi:hypothetical protein
MKSLEQFNQIKNNLSSNIQNLEEQKVKFQRQLAHFVEGLESGQTVGDKELIKKSQQGINILEEKLHLIDSQLNNLNLVPYAQNVIDEAETMLSDLHEKVQQQWEKIISKRIEFLKSLEEMGKLRRKAQEVCWATSEPARVLRMNPLPYPGISGQHQLIVPLDHINKLIGA